MLPAMKITEPYSPMARAKREREAGQQRRQRACGRITRSEGLQRARAQRGGRFLELAIEVVRAPAAPCAPRTAGR